MIAGLESVTAGVLRIDRRVVNQVERRAREIAMVFQGVMRNTALLGHHPPHHSCVQLLTSRREFQAPLTPTSVFRQLTESKLSQRSPWRTVKLLRNHTEGGAPYDKGWC
ncbi:hypothetical protein BMJ32_01660 [Sinorhizobium medicae]|nr:hypothetical protein BMJ32_01660 [Sinorhizobium medicae]PLU59393.1 hypothetical protein BMJ23_02585 [Sinorhizobium medicae]PLU61175.1 hypothetical protein BMJ21_32040 [Sinorhizobium medicae]PLU83468.1 hypothetical protein BMJ22_04465 [Sinorhizobium medicae]RVJ19580.1 hypothetical protein CN179_29350 [Sinorhizobium medicae]